MIGLCTTVVLAGLAATGGSWCDVPFRDVAETAEHVLLARVETDPEGAPSVRVVDVFKGDCDCDELDLGEVLAGMRTKDRVLLALDSEHRPLDILPGVGACRAVSVLKIRGGKLSRSERTGFDYGDTALTLDEIRRSLTVSASVAPASHR